jgi:hypothetical protein
MDVTVCESVTLVNREGVVAVIVVKGGSGGQHSVLCVEPY